MRKCPPVLPPIRGDVQQRIDDESHVVLAWATSLTNWRNEVINEGSLGVGRTAGMRSHNFILRDPTFRNRLAASPVSVARVAGKGEHGAPRWSVKRPRRKKRYLSLREELDSSFIRARYRCQRS